MINKHNYSCILATLYPCCGCMMIAAHDWDIMGAAWAGFQTAFISRGEKQYIHEKPKPTKIASGIEDLSLSM